MNKHASSKIPFNLGTLKPSSSIMKIFTNAVPFILAVIFIVTCTTSISYKSRTRDEARHLVRGLMLLETSDYRLNKHHPVFANVLNAVPLMFIDDLVVPDTDTPEWENADKDKIAADLVELNGGSWNFVPTILNPARMVTIVAMAISVVILYFVILREWGTVPAVIFEILYTFSPNMIAHSRLVTTDAWVVPLIFGATFALYRYMKTRQLPGFITFTLLSFLSLITKYSAVPIAVFWLILLFIFEYQNQKKGVPRIRRFLSACSLPIVSAISWVILMTEAYGFRFTTLASTNYLDTATTNDHLSNIARATQSVSFLTKPLQNAYLHLKLPFAEYIQGFYENVILHDVYGHDSFLFGMYSKKGWWYFFPLVMLVKMPVAVLLAILALLGEHLNNLRHTLAQWFMKKKKNMKISFPKLQPFHVFFMIPALFFALSMKSSINLGIRHILVIFPFIYLGIGLLVQKHWNKKLIYTVMTVLLSIWYIISSLSIFPHYLEYFNELVGGPKNGYLYLLDSNLSWTQDKFYVDTYLDALPDGIGKGRDIYVNPLHEVKNGIVVYDVDILMGRDSGKRDDTAWIRNQLLDGKIAPTDRIAYTYLVFDIKEK